MARAGAGAVCSWAPSWVEGVSWVGELDINVAHVQIQVGYVGTRSDGEMIPARPKLGWCFCFRSETLDDCVFEVRSSSTLDARWKLRLCRRLRETSSYSYESAFARSHLSI